MNAWDRVKIARLLERPTSLDYIENVVDEFIEFHGDRSFGDDNSIVGGIGRIGKYVWYRVSRWQIDPFRSGNDNKTMWHHRIRSGRTGGHILGEGYKSLRLYL